MYTVARGKLDKAEALARDLQAIYRKKPFPGTTGPAADTMLLASILLERGQAVEAEKMLREALAIYQKDKPEGNNETLHATSSTALVFWGFVS